MPYRRLPNTDTARIRAIKCAIDKGKELPPNRLAFSSRTLVRLQRILPLFENNIIVYRQSILSQSKKSRDYNETTRKARTYLTHFIKVMNMAVVRGELPPETRTFYGIPVNDGTVPSLYTENELLSWGRRIIEGEEFRIRKGGSPITNPTIAVVKIRFEHFVDAWTYYNTLAKRTLDITEKNSILRKEADEAILQLWNEVEAYHSNLPEEERKRQCEDYGVIYFYRRNELERSGMEEVQSQLWS